MKKILFAVIMLGGVMSASAASSSNNTVLESSMTVNTVSVSSFTATLVPALATVMNDRTSLVIQNLDSTNDVYCSDKATLTTSSNSFKLAAGGGMISLNLRTYSAALAAKINIYCLSGSTTGPSTIAVIQAY